MATVQQVYESALAIMNETTDLSYENRVIPLVNALIGQCWQMSEDYDTGSRSIWLPVEDKNDEIIGIDQTIALSVMPYGLAAQLYLDEDSIRANSWWQVYQDGLVDARRSPAKFKGIEDVYGILQSNNQDGRW